MFMKKSANVPIPGYLYSMVLKHPGAGKTDKSGGQIDVCALTGKEKKRFCIC